MKNTQNMRHLPFIDGLRGIAMLMVLFEHFVLRGLKHDGINLPFVQQAWFGVYLFFVLSGFVL